MNKTKILIVEDESVVALDIKNSLKNLNYEIVAIVASGIECLKEISIQKPDLILMDIILQGKMDGIDTSAEIRKKYDIPIIFLTAHSDESTFDRVVSTDHYGYIVKPVSNKELKTSIETSLYRYEVDKKVRESEMKFRNLFNQSRDANYLSDNDGTFIDVNKSMINLFGYNKEELLSLNVLDLFIDEKDAEVYLKDLNKNGYIDRYEVRLKKKDNKEIICLISSTKLIDDWKKQYGIQGIIRDISERKEMENEKEVLLHNLSVRIKELNCLFTLSNLIEKPGIDFYEILEVMVEVFRVSWQYPDIACSKIIYKDIEYKTKNFQKTIWKQSSDIIVNNERSGIIEIYYLEQRPDIYEGPFMKEERALIDTVSSRLGRFIERVKAYEDLKRSNFELQNLSAHLQSVREEERTRISREIHDELGQALTVMKMDISWLSKEIANDRTDLKKKSAAILEIVDNTIQTVRRISSDLRPGILDDLGLYAAIEWQASEIEKRSGIKIKLNIGIESQELDISDEQKISLFRIFQEAMTNIVRHSCASKAQVDFKINDNSIIFEISDNGIGITEEQINYTNSCGIIGMRERIHHCGGIIDITGERDRGTIIKISIPIGYHN